MYYKHMRADSIMICSYFQSSPLHASSATHLDLHWSSVFALSYLVVPGAYDSGLIAKLPLQYSVFVKERHVNIKVHRTNMQHLYTSIIQDPPLLLIPPRISNHMPGTVWDEITCPFPDVNGATVEVWEWISNFIPHFIMDILD